MFASQREIDSSAPENTLHLPPKKWLKKWKLAYGFSFGKCSNKGCKMLSLCFGEKLSKLESALQISLLCSTFSHWQQNILQPISLRVSPRARLWDVVSLDQQLFPTALRGDCRKAPGREISLQNMIWQKTLIKWNLTTKCLLMLTCLKFQTYCRLKPALIIISIIYCFLKELSVTRFQRVISYLQSNHTASASVLTEAFPYIEREHKYSL